MTPQIQLATKPKAAHTPGPWKVWGLEGEGIDGELWIGPVDPNAEIIADIVPTNPLSEEAEANARLMAASPEMFALLERIPEIFQADENWTTMKKWLDDYKAVARKVRGGA